jgi:ELWxxDGT repeat protein
MRSSFFLIILLSAIAVNGQFEFGTFDVNPNTSSYPGSLISDGDKLYFKADNGFNGYELWITDGTDEGTQMVKDINPGVSQSHIRNITKCASNLFFQANDGTNGVELWVTDGTETGTQLVKNINIEGGSHPEYLIEYGGRLYFQANDGVNGRELWVTDGTETGTYLFKDMYPGAADGFSGNLVICQGKLFFSGKNSSGTSQLWATDGTAAGTELIREFNSGNNYTTPSFIIEYSGKLYFISDDGIYGKEIWSTDGTPSGTSLLKDIRTGFQGATFQGFKEYGGKLYFAANDGTTGMELWITDGTTAGTQLLKDIHSGSNNSFPASFQGYNGKLFFQADDGINGRELWITEGTTISTQMFKDINPGAGSGVSDYDVFLTEYNGKLLFQANDGVHGFELWSSDGSPDGTLMVSDILLGEEHSNPQSQITYYAGKLFFVAAYEPYNYQLCVTDGTQIGTNYLHPTGDMDYDPFDVAHQVALPDFVEMGGRLYFAAQYDSTGYELWYIEAPFVNAVNETTIKGLNIFPNPSSSILNIQTDDNIQSVSIYNNLGALVHTEFRNSFSIAHLPKGVYIMHFEMEGGVSVRKVIIN